MGCTSNKNDVKSTKMSEKNENDVCVAWGTQWISAEVPSKSVNDERKRKSDKNRAKTMKTELSFQDFCNLVSWSKELKSYFQDFDFHIGDLKDELGRHSTEEQSRATNWGLVGAID
ncbi:hypothetical protein M9H77_23822 [Catharanthus roseus]|uniref:Uncharacterized protein n=1 Tax=Catharanthus roseus TaxID=4058 RepID=A0ACC0AWJ4_CATRO|nr:hypothetical protein M9H77_23822 [Catharanthus roseus]